jgi:hypothetical protein
MTAILGQLRAAAPDAEIILTGSYDPDVGARRPQARPA